MSRRILCCMVLLEYLGSCVVIAQAPGDGDPLCTDEVINGMTNPFFFDRPTYGTSERPLMDSRDYTRLLQGSMPWQSVDNDNNNTVGVAPAVRKRLVYFKEVYVTGSEKTTLIAQKRKNLLLTGTVDVTMLYLLQFVSGA